MNTPTRTRPATIPTRAGTASSREELTADRITKSLLGYGVIAGPIYVYHWRRIRRSPGDAAGGAGPVEP